jgi:hypothetical protein
MSAPKAVSGESVEEESSCQIFALVSAQGTFVRHNRFPEITFRSAVFAVLRSTRNVVGVGP